ncbi:MAG: SDR family oxidoreductase [Sinobacteraceae bacterium]|nr:SDR family oxidoreductase [Nevskiaceae bacterium]
MTLPLAGKHAVVTGGGRGIGAAVAQLLSESGASVTLFGRSVAPLEQQAARLENAVALPCDVSDEQAVANAFGKARDRFGDVAILVNNAGAAESAPFLSTDLAVWQRLMEVNLLGTVLCVRQALPAMVAAGFGRIVNVASTAALRGYAYVSAYCAAKHAVLGLTRSLALEVARKGVTVNAVCPGYVDTDMTRETIARIVAKTGRTQAQALDELVRGNPQGRLVKPFEVATAVVNLCRPGSDAITGQAISVSGGEVMQ